MPVLPVAQATPHNQVCFCQTVHLVPHFLASIQETDTKGNATASGPSARTPGLPPEMQALGRMVESFCDPCGYIVQREWRLFIFFTETEQRRNQTMLLLKDISLV